MFYNCFQFTPKVACPLDTTAFKCATMFYLCKNTHFYTVPYRYILFLYIIYLAMLHHDHSFFLACSCWLWILNCINVGQNEVLPSTSLYRCCSECGEICYRYIRGVQQRMGPHIYIDIVRLHGIWSCSYMSSIWNPLTFIAMYLILWLGGHLLWSVWALKP